MISLMTRILGDKKEWKAMEARANALPRDYRTVYGAMKSYLWRFTAGDGKDIVAILKDVLGLFETGAAKGTSVLEVTGEDVAAFCDERLRGTTPYVESFLDRWRDSWRDSLAREVAKKVAE
jgi:DNA-binding ferritin-like protein (Dps family)